MNSRKFIYKVCPLLFFLLHELFPLALSFCWFYVWVSNMEYHFHWIMTFVYPFCLTRITVAAIFQKPCLWSSIIAWRSVIFILQCLLGSLILVLIFAESWFSEFVFFPDEGWLVAATYLDVCTGSSYGSEKKMKVTQVYGGLLPIEVPNCCFWR